MDCLYKKMRKSYKLKSDLRGVRNWEHKKIELKILYKRLIPNS